MRQSAGILLYRVREEGFEVFLVHPGGPFWQRKDTAAWSIPKGEFEEGEDPLSAARRELAEETGLEVSGPFLELGLLRQAGGKTVYAWAVEGDCDPAAIVSNTFEMEWPPKSGSYKRFPEVDRAAWFGPGVAESKLHKGQVEFIDRLRGKLRIAEDGQYIRSSK